MNWRPEGFEGGGNLLLIDRDLLIAVLLLGRYAAIRLTHPRVFLLGETLKGTYNYRGEFKKRHVYSASP